jgi:hypothetical protein
VAEVNATRCKAADSAGQARIKPWRQQLLSFGVGLSAADTHDSMLLEAMVDAVPRSRVRVAGQVGLASTEGDSDGA